MKLSVHHLLERYCTPSPRYTRLSGGWPSVPGRQRHHARLRPGAPAETTSGYITLESPKASWTELRSQKVSLQTKHRSRSLSLRDRKPTAFARASSFRGTHRQRRRFAQESSKFHSAPLLPFATC